MSLLPWLKIVCGVHEDEEHADAEGEEAEGGREGQAELVERIVVP